MRISLDGVSKHSRRQDSSRQRHALGHAGAAARRRRPERRRQVDAAPARRRARRARRGRGHADAGDADRRLSAAGARAPRRARRCSTRSRGAPASRRPSASSSRPRPRSPPARTPTTATRPRSTASSRSAAAISSARAGTVAAELGLPGLARPADDGALRRRGGTRGAGRDPALALRRAASRRADERPRLRRARAARALPRVARGRARRRLARPGVPRPDGDADRRDRAGLAARARVGRRLQRVRGGARLRRAQRPTRASSRPRSGAARSRRSLVRRRVEARGGAGLGEKTGGADRRGTNALRGKVRQAERALERADRPEKPFEPWELQLVLESGDRPGDSASPRSHGAVAKRGGFTLGPIDLDARAGRARRSSRAGTAAASRPCSACCSASSRSTEGSRIVGRRTVDRHARAGPRRLRDPRSRCSSSSAGRAGLRAEEARTLLAKFGLGAEHVGRAWARRSRPASGRARSSRSCRPAGSTCSSSTSRRTTSTWRRSSSSRRRCGDYDGTVVLVTHDRRFLERFGATRTISL